MALVYSINLEAYYVVIGGFVPTKVGMLLNERMHESGNYFDDIICTVVFMKL